MKRRELAEGVAAVVRCARDACTLLKFLALLLLVTVPVASASGEPEATGARLSLHPGFTRLTLDLSEPVAIDAFLLDISNQVVVRLPTLDWRLPSRVDNALGSITGFSAQPTGAGSWRLLIEVSRQVTLHRAEVVPATDSGGWSLIVELSDPDLPLVGEVHPSVDELLADHNPFLPDWVSGPRVIVVDPGHGGRDPGASGIGGAIEKEIVLATSMALRDALEAYGNYKVLLTREDDRFLRLDDRSDFAQRVGADLFVSIHADAYHSTVARGASVYSISGLASDRQAAELSGDSSRAMLLADIGYGDQDSAVGDILLDMMMDVTAVDSARLAEAVVASLGQSTRLLDNSHRLAGYHVLKVPHTPSILVELGYLSNALDATDLQDAEHRQMLAEAIAQGIDQFMSTQPLSPMAAADAAPTLDSAATETP